MSDLNDDLLNYELGDVDYQDLADDEDELLLSDEDTSKAQLNDPQEKLLRDETEAWVSKQLTGSETEATEPSDCKTPSGHKESNMTTSESMDVPVAATVSIKPKLNRAVFQKTVAEATVSDEKIDEVTSTYKEIETKQPPDVDEPCEERSVQDEGGGSEYDLNWDTGADGDESDDNEERTNPKTASERSVFRRTPSVDARPDNKWPPHSALKPRGGIAMRGGRPQGPRPLFMPPSNDAYGNQSQPNQIQQQQQQQYGHHDFRLALEMGMRPPMHQMYNGPCDHTFNGGPMPGYRPMHGIRAPLLGAGPPLRHPSEFQQFRPLRPDMLGHPTMMVNQQMSQMQTQSHFRLPYNAQSIYRPQPNGIQLAYDPYRPVRLPRPPQFIQRPPYAQQQPLAQRNIDSGPPPSRSLNVMGPAIVPSACVQPLLPRKVLINPNFKGGVQAATNQLMMDTMKSSQFGAPSVSNDAELLRQQEEFINKNRMHIEKRRYEWSPERTFSPPRRNRHGDLRERDHRGGRERGYSDGPRRMGPSMGRGGRTDGRSSPKQRRSESFDRQRDSTKQNEPEDDETRAYRLEIEKQKAMREKIVRDKEMRRRRAAEDKLKSKEPSNETSVDDQTAEKLKPLVVKQRKIISLKKKSDREPSRTLPTAKILPETKRIEPSMAVVKPVVKKQAIASGGSEKLSNDKMISVDNSPVIEIGAKSAQSARRIVLKPSSEVQPQRMIVNPLDADVGKNNKGIFDRLDKKIGVNEASKRKIQRIVINNLE